MALVFQIVIDSLPTFISIYNFNILLLFERSNNLKKDAFDRFRVAFEKMLLKKSGFESSTSSSAHL